MSGRVEAAGDVPRYPAPAPGFTYQPWMFQTGRDNAPACQGGGVRRVCQTVARLPRPCDTHGGPFWAVVTGSRRMCPKKRAECGFESHTLRT